MRPWGVMVSTLTQLVESLSDPNLKTTRPVIGDWCASLELVISDKLRGIWGRLVFRFCKISYRETGF